ncbi:MAG: YceI family protein [Flavobacteriales bacterium]
MKKVTIPVFVAAVAFSIASCGNKANNAGEAQNVAAASSLSKAFTVDAAGSVLNWKATKKVGGGHNGNVQLSEGTINVENNEITAGNFTINMETIQSTDLTPETGKADLEAHLKGTGKPEAADHFFNVSKYPTAKFEITGTKRKSPDSVDVMGNLTIKDITKNITIPSKVVVDSTKFEAAAKFNINRQDWNVKYGSVEFDPKILGDRVINNEVEFDLNLKATPKK